MFHPYKRLILLQIVLFLPIVHMYAPSGGRNGIHCSNKLLSLRCQPTEVVVVNLQKGGPPVGTSPKPQPSDNCTHDSSEDCLADVTDSQIKNCVWKASSCNLRYKLASPFLCNAKLAWGIYAMYSNFVCIAKNRIYNICGDGSIDTTWPWGYVLSPDFPGYPESLPGQCKKDLYLRQGYGLQVTIVYMNLHQENLQTNRNCSQTHLTFLGSSSVEVKKFCGLVKNKTFVIPDSKVTVQFVAGSHRNKYDGFSFYFTEIKLEDESRTTDDFRSTTGSSNQTSLDPPCNSGKHTMSTNTPTSHQKFKWQVAFAVSAGVAAALLCSTLFLLCGLRRRHRTGSVDIHSDNVSRCSKVTTSSHKELLARRA